jgi:hypothetical protein
MAGGAGGQALGRSPTRPVQTRTHRGLALNRDVAWRLCGCGRKNAMPPGRRSQPRAAANPFVISLPWDVALAACGKVRTLKAQYPGPRRRVLSDALVDDVGVSVGGHGGRRTTKRPNPDRVLVPPPRTCRVVAPAVGLSRESGRPARFGSEVRGGVAWSGARRGCCGPELGGAAAGEGALAGCAAGGGEVGECLVDALTGEVALA